MDTEERVLGSCAGHVQYVMPLLQLQLLSQCQDEIMARNLEKQDGTAQRRAG